MPYGREDEGDEGLSKDDSDQDEMKMNEKMLYHTRGNEKI